MQLDRYTAVVDNDFVDHLAGANLTDMQLVEVLHIVFAELNLSAAMHPLVYDKELLKDKHRIKLLFDKEIVCKAEFSDIFLGDMERKAHYIYLVKSFYRFLSGEALPVKDDEVLTYWVREKNLGEVHSFVMCLLCGCGMFLSDDEDSKKLMNNLKRVTTDTVTVYSREEFINKHMAEGKTKFKRGIRRSLTHERC